MAVERTAQRSAAPADRRRAVSPATRRATIAPPDSTGRTLQRRFGNQATQAIVARSVAGTGREVSKPTDRAEREAEDHARKVVRMRDASSSTAPTPGSADRVQRAAAQGKPVPAAAPTAPRPPARVVSIAGGSPLPGSVRPKMERRFGASFGNVRIHTDEAAAQQSAALNANAFTIGQHIFFGKHRFQPHSAAGEELIAHELTHTVQQGAAVQGDLVQRSAAAPVSEQVAPQVQRSIFDIPDPREYFARQARAIPGFTMLTVAIGYNPITNERVERNAGNILRGAIELMPGGSLVTEALNNHGVFDRVSVWAEAQFDTIRDIGDTIYQEIEGFIDRFDITDLASPGEIWDRARGIVDRPIAKVVAFARGLKDGIVALIKEAILKPIAAFARTVPGYTLLCTVMGRDPISGERVPQDPEALLGGFLTFIGEEEVWNRMQQAKAVPRIFAWFRGVMIALVVFVAEIPSLFVQAFKSLEIADIILVPRAFMKVAAVFGGFAIRFITWGATVIWNLLEIIFDVVSPGALMYIKKTGAALKAILRDPLPFVTNLVKAAKLGFLDFADNFLGHLKAGLIDWLTGSLPGIYIPKAFSLTEIVKFAFSVLGLTWANIRQKLVKATSETVVKTLEAGFDIVVTLVRDGPAAAWDLIKEQLANLRNMVIGGITSFIVDMVVKKAIPKLIAMFIPGAGFISAIISIYDTIMVFVNKIKRIIAVVKGFIDSIVAIAAGQVGAAAARVEKALAGVLSLAISFLAGFAGLGKVADKVMAVIEKIRAPIDKALDWLVGWIVKAAKGLIAKGKAAVGRLLRWAFATTGFKDGKGQSHTLYVSDKGVLTIESAPQAAREFVQFFVKNMGGDAKLAADIYKLIDKAQGLVTAIEKSPDTGPDGVPAPAKQRELLALNTQICALISQLVGANRDVGKLKEKYLLEGQVGTYATIPKPVGDKLTPDHQPQASVILGAADFFRETLGIDGGELAKRAEKRADQGFAINLHFKRHVAGATYGSKGETRKGFKDRLVAATTGMKLAAAKAKVVEFLRSAVKTDAAQMKQVAARKVTDPAWQQLKEEFGNDKDAEDVRSQIAGRIGQGEDQIVSQPFDF